MMPPPIPTLPGHPTLMELRSAGWTAEDIATTYGVCTSAVLKALIAGHPHRLAP